MKKVLSLFVIALSLISMTACSSDESPLEDNRANTSFKTYTNQTADNELGTPILVSDFINLVKPKCSDIELDYLNSLNPNDTIYIRDKSQENYPQINKENINIYKELAKGNLSFSPLNIKPTIKTTTQSRGWSDIIEERIGTVGVKEGYNPILEFDVRLLADISYSFNVTQDRIESQWGCIINVYAKAQDHPSVMLDFVDQGSRAYPTDNITITYSVLGKVVLSAAFGDIVAGAPIDQVNETGNFIVGW